MLNDPAPSGYANRNPAGPSGSAVPEGFTLPWNTTRTMADVWRVSLAWAARRKAELAELRRQADEAAGRGR